ncbi:glycoside hydrolase family 114 protein, partial [Piromyces sp. E2]
LSNVNADRWRPTPGLSWDYLLGSDARPNITRDVVTFDLEYAKEMVPLLHSRGQKAVCYFSGGTTDGKPDKDEFVKAGLVIYERGDGDWGNNLLDIKNKKKLQPLIRKRFQRAVEYKCDGVEVDVLDLYSYYPERFTKDDSYVFAKWVAETGHQENISVGLKNLSSLAPRLVNDFDFAVVESCANYNECSNFKKFTDNNKAVFIVHY